MQSSKDNITSKRIEAELCKIWDLLKVSVNKRGEDHLVKLSKMKRRKSCHFLKNVIVMVVCSKAVYLKKGSLFSFLCFICNAEKTLLLYQCCQL